MDYFIHTGTRKLHARLEGRGSPTVVIEVGSTVAGAKTHFFDAIREPIARETSVLMYDRANLGDSDPAPMPRPITAFAEDLRLVLTGTAALKPYVLAGGSFGGLIVTHYAALYPQDVAGIVLEDSTHPEHNARTLALLPPVSPGEPQALANFRNLLLAEMSGPSATLESEGLDYPLSARQMRQAWDLGDIPLTVLTAGQDTWEEGFPMDVADRYEQLWMVLQDELAARSTRSKQAVVAESGHCIHDDAPQVMIEAIREMIVRARKA